MQPVLRYHGREVHAGDVACIRQVIDANPGATRRAISIKVCEIWGWRQHNGVLCDAQCRGLLLQLHRAGLVPLPPPQWIAKQPRRHAVVAHVDVAAVPLATSLAEVGPVEMRQVRRTPDEALVKSLIAEHHYLGYTHSVGEHLKYLVTARGNPIACLCLSSAPRHLAPRDRFIGWSKDKRKANIRFIAYQSRFLILPSVRVPHLASHLLGCISRRLPSDWQQLYGHPVYFTETFVDPARYRGTCYKAANWVLLGMTTGRGKNDQTGRPNRSLKQVLGYPLVKNFRELLCA